MKGRFVRLLSLCLFVFLIFGWSNNNIIAQGSSCNSAEPFCTGTVATFPAGVNSGNAPFGNNYGCLFTRPNPAWYFMEIDEPGNMSINLSNSNNVDIDFILWGPFPNLATALNSCGDLGNGGPNGTNVIQSCSYSPAPNETASLTGAQTGQVYILLITNFSNNATNITFTDNPSSTATTNCGILDCSIEITGSIIPATCGNNNGSVSIEITGGSGSYGISWSNGTSGATTINNLSPGTYTVTVTDIDNPDCTNEESFTVIDEGNLELDAEFTPTTCGEDNGSATILITDGQGPYIFKWPAPITGNTDFQENLPAGNYQITVTDQTTGCEETIQVNIEPSEDLMILETVNTTTCEQDNGSIQIEVTNGSGSYVFEWSDENLFGDDLSDLEPGTYGVTITDLMLGCSIEREFIVGTSPPLVIQVDSSSTTCGQDNGFISLTVIQGLGPYSYNWFGASPNTATAITDLPAGTYIVEVIDEGGDCREILEIEILPSDPLIIDVDIVPTTCGEDNGEISIDVSNGSGDYTFAWLEFGGYVAPSIGNLPSGTYTVIVRDEQQFCSEEIDIIIEPSEVLDIEIDITPTTCNEVNGAFEIIVWNGSGTYDYVWNTSEIVNESANNLSPGTYLVTITDQVFGCVEERSVTIDASEELSFDVQVDNTTCGQDNGSIQLFALNGSGDFLFEWVNTNANTASAGNLPGGETYSVVVTDLQDNCTFETSQFIEASEMLDVDIQINELICGPNDASAEVIVHNGSGDFTYEWNDFPGQTGSSLSGIPAGSFEFSILDNVSGCRFDSIFTIASLSPLNIACNVLEDESIFGENDGSIQIVISEGEGPFQISLDNGTEVTVEESTNRTVLFDKLSPGTIEIIVTDANGCTTTCSLTIEAGPCALTATIEEIIHPSCNGFSDGLIRLTTNSPQEVEFVWAAPLEGESTKEVTGLSAGIYPVTITDYLGCQIVLNPELLEPDPITLQCNITQQESSKGANDGTLTTNFSGGTAPYDLILLLGGTILQSETATNTAPIEFDGLSPGTYTISLVDANGCEEFCQIEIIEGPCILNVEASIDHVSCFGAADGQISLDITGDKGMVNISWPAFNPEAAIMGTNASSLSAGSFVIRVQDEENCRDTVEITLTEPDPISLTCIALHETEALAGDGSILLDISSFQAPLNAVLNTIPNQTITADTPEEIVFQNLVPGIYQILVTDANGCSASCQTIINPADCELKLELISAQNLSCFESENGAIEVMASGATGEIDYLWSGAISASEESTLDSLPAGNYIIQAIDVRGCSDEVRVQLTQPDKLTIQSQVTNPKCNQPNGSIAININGGVPEYDIAWSDGPSADKFRTDLGEGEYTVTITDGNACLESMDFDLYMQESPEIIDSTINHVSCNGNNNGRISIEISGGSPTYSYSWSNGITGVSEIENLTAGAYTVSISDSNDCTITQDFLISQPSILEANVIISDPDCGKENGAIELVVAGGVGPYSVGGDLSGDEQIFMEIASGNYQLTITDANQCQTQVSFEMVSRELPVSNAGVDVTLSCREPSVEVNSPLTFLQGYTYQWYRINSEELIAENTLSIITSEPGAYELRVTHPDNGCIGRDTVLVNNDINEIIFVETEFRDPLCFGSNNGQIIVGEIEGGTAPFQYILNGVIHTVSDFTNLEPAEYNLDIIDAGGCTWPTITYTLEEPALLEIELPGSYFADRGEEVLLQPSLSDYSRADFITWSDSSGILCSNCDGLDFLTIAQNNASFQVTVEDQNGCLATAYTNLFVRQVRNIYIPNAFTPNSDQTNDRFFVYGGDLLKAIKSIEVFDRWGSKLYHEDNLLPQDELKGWDGTFRGRAMQPGAYIYTITVEYLDGETDTFYGEVNLLR